VTSWTAAFGTAPPPIAFVPALPRGRRRRRPLDVDRLYDATIVRRRVVPSRPRHWHDFLNALVWATFPRAKAALHARQLAAITRRLEPGAPRLPTQRTRELDGLAMIDEGGVIALVAPPGQKLLIFGHAIYESFVLGATALTARMVQLPVAALTDDPLAQADRALAAALADDERLLSPAELLRLDVPTGAPATAWASPPRS
jgi:hypothetical protein